MITVTLNGGPQQVAPDATVLDLVADVTGRRLAPDGTPTDGGRLGVAVALDSTVVPRSRWGATGVPADAQVEIITAMQGG